MALRLNSTDPEAFDATPEPSASEKNALKQRELESWENEGGEVPTVPTPQQAVDKPVSHVEDCSNEDAMGEAAKGGKNKGRRSGC